MDEYYDKITGNPKYALHGMCNPLMIWQQRKAETDGLDAYKARNIYYHSIFDDLVKINNRIIVDEPFSALDAISEQHIIKRLNLKTKMSITIFITHRYSSLRLADFILVLKDGELVESGSHQELQKAGKYYSELIKAQIEPIDHLAQLDET